MFCSLHTKVRHATITSVLAHEIEDISASITAPGRELLTDKYLLRNKEGHLTESINHRLLSACAAFATDSDHARRLAKYISKGWFMFATPLLSNGGTSRGLPISCFLSYIPDSLEGMGDSFTEAMLLAASGGGLGSHWSDVRSKGTATSKGSETSGVVPFMKIYDSIVTGVNQGLTRRGAGATYLRYDHPEILEFLSIRTSTGGDINRKTLNTHHGVVIDYGFIDAVNHNLPIDLVDPHTKEVTGQLSARYLMGEIIKTRMTQRGEPYLFNVEEANANSPYSSSAAIKGSNLCTEITLKTDEDNTAVCCLSSINAAKYEEYRPVFKELVSDLVEMLDNALEVFINQAPESMHKAVHSAKSERSIGLGLMGCHSYVQSEGVTLLNSVDISLEIEEYAWEASYQLGKKRGGVWESFRNFHITAIAPNASSSIMLGVSPGIEPWRSNCFTVEQGSLIFEQKNPELESIIDSISYLDSEETWQDIRDHNGSVQHVPWIGDAWKKVFRTATEIDQKELVITARLRQQYIDQAQSLNLFFESDADPKYVLDTHRLAFDYSSDVGVPLKSLYYCRTSVTNKVESPTSVNCPITQPKEDDICLPCQG